jgi:ElaB/YqjD/DUF883 family membrane-anchored ribosome-binding protein
MDEQDFNSGSQNYSSTGAGGVGQEPGANETSTNKSKVDMKESITAVKDKVSEQANELRGKFNEQAGELREKFNEQASTISNQLSQRIDNARGKTSAGLRNTSQRIQNLALYMEEHDAKDMSEAVVRTSKELIRKHPGKSLIVGLVAGMLVGRIFSIGGGGERRY